MRFVFHRYMWFLVPTIAVGESMRSRICINVTWLCFSLEFEPADE